MTNTEAIQCPSPRPPQPASQSASPCFGSKRLAREWHTMAAMIGCYCRGQHGTRDALCPECRGLLDYAAVRLERCRFGPEKPVCAKCPVHCYQRARREQVRVVMRYAGPRMVWQHPLLSLRHWLDGLRAS
jgi:Nitrous oxide-stimulated promoter